MVTGTDSGFVAFDTFAWMELLGDGPHAAAVARLMDRHHVATPVAVLAELSHLYAVRMPARRRETIAHVAAASLVLPLTAEVAEAAGVTRAELQPRRRGLGLVDCIVYETARAKGMPLVTGDPHLEGLPGVRFLR